MATGIRYPGDFQLISVTVHAATKDIDLFFNVIELSYNEDLFNNTASGYVMVKDSIDLLNTMSLSGNEFIHLHFGKADDTTFIIKKSFRIFTVSKREPLNDGNTETYSIYFCSEELLLSEQYKISKSYKNSDIATNIKDILKTYLQVPDKKIAQIDNTYGVYDFIVPFMKPFDAINWLATYARPGAFGSTTMVGADMLFYENKFGYNFRSLQSLYEQSSMREYMYTPKNLKINDMDYNLRNALSYEIMDSFDTLAGINQGMFANRLLSVDPLLRRYKVTDFSYADYNNKVEKLNNWPITNNFKNRIEDTVYQTPEASFKLVFANSNQNDYAVIKNNPGSVTRDIFAETYIPNRTAQIPLANYQRMKISVWGDPSLTVGTVITFNLLSKNPIKQDKGLDDFYSGNYLVTAVRHVLDQFKYRTILEICKESVSIPYSEARNGSTGWSNAVKGVI
jgi:hypothetical protein